MTAPSPDLVPGWLERSAAVGWRVLATAGMAVVAGFVVMTVPLSATATLVSLVLAAALAPTAIRLRARGLPRQAAAAITFGAGAALIVASVVLLLVVLVPDLRAVGSAVQAGLDALRDRLADLGAPDEVSSLVDGLAASIRTSLTPDLTALVGTAANVGTVLVLGTFLTYFLLADGDRGWAWAMGSLRPDQADVVAASARDGVERVAWYVRRTALLATVDAVVTGVVLTLLGVPLAGALGAVAFLAGFVPYLGAVAGGAIIGLAAFALGGWVPAVLVLVALVAAWVVSTRLLETTSMSRAIDVHPVIVLVALPAGVTLFGVLGLLALLPITVFGLAISRSVIALLDLAPQGGIGATPDETGEPEDADAIPVWLDRLGQWSWRALVLAALAGLTIVVVVRLPSVVVPAVIAVVGAATLLPVVDRLQKRGWSRSLGAGVATVGTLAFIVVTTLIAVGMTLGPLREVVDTAVAGAAGAGLDALAAWVAESGGDLQLNLAGLFVDLAMFSIALLLALLMTFFFVRDGRTWWHALLARLAAGRREPVGEAGGKAVDLLAGYMIGTAAISAFGGITSGLILVILGLPLALPVAVIGFYAGFIPYVGSFITTAIALLITVALGTTSDIIVMLVFTVVFNIAQGNFVTPLVYGKSLSLHPAIVLMAIPVGNEIAGILGMFLVVPAAAMIAATWRHVIAAIDASGVPPHADPDAAPAAPGDAPDPGGDPAYLTDSDRNPPVPSGA